MADRRLLEDGSRRLQEDGSSRLLEQQGAIGVTALLVEDDDTLAASIALASQIGSSSGSRRGVRKTVFRMPTVQEFHPPIDLSAALVEDDDVLVARIAVLPGRKGLRNRRAATVLLLN